MQMSLIHETVNDAIREAIHFVGGNKKVGALLYPEMPVDQAAGRVRDCLNPDRRELFSPEQVLMIARLAKAAGNNSIMEFMALELGYLKPVAVDPDDEIARLQREFVEATKSLHHMASRIEAISATAAMRRVA